MPSIVSVIVGILALIQSDAFAANPPNLTSYNCGQYKTRYARSNYVDFQLAYNDCVSGKTKLTISCEEFEEQ